MLIRPRSPFNLARTLRFILSPPALLNGRSFAPLLDYFVDGEYRRVGLVNGEPVLYGVTEARHNGSTALRVRILTGPDDSKTRAWARALVERQFSTSLDLAPFYELARRDPVLARLVAHFEGMRVPQAASVYEILISAILEQQVNLSFAHQVKQALIEAYGSHIEFAGRRYNAFPEPAALAITTPKELRRIQVSGPKARYMIEISRRVLDGSLDLEGLRRLDPAAAHERLLASKGVGPWTAQYVGLRALGHLDCLPAADVGLQKCLRLFYGLRKQPSTARVERLAKSWAGWRSYGTFYTWLTYWETPEWRTRLAQEIAAERQKAKQPQRRRDTERNLDLIPA